MTSHSEYPDAIQLSIAFLERHKVVRSSKRWEATLDQAEERKLSDRFSEFRDKNFKLVREAGGLLVHRLRKREPADPRVPEGDSILYMLFPATHGDARSFFDQCDFGLDEYTSVIDGRFLDREQNSPLRIHARRKAAMEIFDAMSAEADVCLSGISETAAVLTFLEKPETKRANYWGDVVWNFYDHYYAREAYKGIHEFSRAYCRKQGREFGEYCLGGWPGGI